MKAAHWAKCWLLLSNKNIKNTESVKGDLYSTISSQKNKRKKRLGVGVIIIAIIAYI